ncbi:MAG: SDR family oxidoreductase [bacterium]
MTIAITGSTGHLGRLAVAALQARVPATDIIALARDPAKAADLGVAVRAFDYGNADPDALKGVDTLVLISSSSLEDRVGDHKRVIAAAKTAGVGRVIYTSILKGHASPMKLADDHKATETALEQSGLTTTILRNGWYTENYTGSLAASVEHGALIGSAGAGLLSTAPRADYAAAIAVVASTDGHDGKVYELAGDRAYTMAEMASEVSKVTGKTIPYNSLPEDVYAGILQGFGLPEVLARILADSDVQATHGALFDDSKTLSRLIGRPTTPMADTVKATLA